MSQDNSAYDQTYQVAAADNGLDPLWLKAQGIVESGLNPNAVNSDTGAAGVAQMMPATAQSLGVKPLDPSSAIPGQARLMAENLKRYGNIQDATLAYHGGTDKTAWGPKTQAYLDKVSQTYQTLKNNANAGASKVTDASSQGQQDQRATPFDDLTSTISSASSASAPAPTAVAEAATPFDELEDAAKVPEAGSSVKQTPKNAAAASKSYDPVDVLLHSLNAVPAGMESGAVNMGLEGVKQAGNFANKVGILPDAVNNKLSQGIQNFRDMQKEDTDSLDPVSNALYSGGQIVPAVAATSGLANAVSTGAKTALSPQALQFINKLRGADAAGNAVPGIANRIGNYISQGLTGAAGGATANSLNAQGSDEDLGTRAKQGAEVGGVLGAAAPAAYDAGAGTANALMGSSIDPKVAQFAKDLDDKYGIKIPAWQLTGNPLIQRLGSLTERLGLNGQSNVLQKANEAIATAIGAPGESSLTPEVMSKARSNNSAGYEAVLDRIGSIPVGDLDSKLANILDSASTSLDANQLQPLRNLANKLMNNVQDGDVIPAKVYKSMIKQGSDLDNATSSPTIGPQAQKMEDALRDSMKAAATPEDADELSKLDYQWKNMRTVQRLAAKAGPTGEISPTKLIGPVAQSFKDMAYSGGGALGDIAQAGQQFKLTPSSGTAENNLLLRMLIPDFGSKLGIGTGLAETGVAAYNPMLALKVAAARAAALGTGRLAGAAMSSDAYRNALLNSALSHGRGVGSAFDQSYIPAAAVGTNKLLNPSSSSNGQ